MIRSRQGSVMLITLLALPVMVSLVLLISAAGSLYASRGRLQAAADMAALAGVQELDWDLLAQGRAYLIEDRARQKSLETLWLNLGFIPGVDLDEAETSVEIINAAPDDPIRHPRTGRWVEYPTVWVWLEVPVMVAGLGERQARLWASADATVEPRR